MKRISNVALLAVAAVVLAACSSGNGSSSSTSSTASSSSAPISSSASASGIPAPTPSTAVPSGLDAASTTWFDVLCTKLLVPLHDITYAHIPTGTDQSAAAEDSPTQQEADRQARLAALNQAATALAGTPPPGFDGGTAYAAAVSTALETTSQTVTADPAQASDLSPSGPFHPLDLAISQVDPTVRNYALLIPSCNAAGGLPNETNPPATTAAPADLDATSISWFDTLCTSVASMGGPGATTAEELLAQQKAFADTMTKLATTLEATPPPGFDGGPAWAASVIAVLQYSGATMTASLPQYAADLAALDPNDSAAFQRFKSGHAQPAGLAEGYGVLATMNTQLDPAITAAVRAIPSCTPVFG